MTRARLEAVAADTAAAEKLLHQAARQLDDAGSASLSPESAYALAYQAALKALIGVLLGQGKRVSSGSGGHVVIIREGALALGLDSDLSSRLDRMRRIRHATFYEVDEVSAAMVKSALTDAAAVVAEAVAAQDRGPGT